MQPYSTTLVKECVIVLGLFVIAALLAVGVWSIDAWLTAPFYR